MLLTHQEASNLEHYCYGTQFYWKAVPLAHVNGSVRVLCLSKVHSV